MKKKGFKRMLMAVTAAFALISSMVLPVCAESLTIVDAEGEYVATSPDDVRFPEVFGNWSGYGFIKVEDFEAFRAAYEAGEHVYAVDYAYDGLSPLPSGSKLYTIYTQQETVFLIPKDADTGEVLDYSAPLSAFYEEVVADESPAFEDASQEQAIADMARLMPEFLQYLPSILEMKYGQAYYVVDGNENLTQLYADEEMTQEFDTSSPFVNGALMYAPVYVSLNPPEALEDNVNKPNGGAPNEKENSDDLIETIPEDEPVSVDVESEPAHVQKENADVNTEPVKEKEDDKRPSAVASTVACIAAGTIALGIVSSASYLFVVLPRRKKKNVIGGVIVSNPTDYKIAFYGKKGSYFADLDDRGFFTFRDINADVYRVCIIKRGSEEVVYEAYLDTITKDASKIFVSNNAYDYSLLCEKHGSDYDIEIRL